MFTTAKNLYAIKNPKGALAPATIATTKAKSWELFDVAANGLESPRKELEKEGFKAVAISLIEKV